MPLNSPQTPQLSPWTPPNPSWDLPWTPPGTFLDRPVPPPRLKPIQKVEGVTNGVAAGPPQPAGLSDISSQVQQYQQFLGEPPPETPLTPTSP